MSDGLSQADLDALFAGGPGTADDSEGKARKEEGGLCQADLDALFAGFGEPCEPEPAKDVKKEITLKMEEAWQTPPPAEDSKGETLSQEDIDKMLAEFGL